MPPQMQSFGKSRGNMETFSSVKKLGIVFLDPSAPVYTRKHFKTLNTTIRMGTPKFRIYPSIGIARLGNGKAEQSEVVFSPEVPWKNLYEQDNDYIADDGALKKMAQRFYIYACNDKGNPTHKIKPEEYDIEWTAEVANKKPFWYDFNNSLDLSIQTKNQNLSPKFYEDRIAPGISASYRNPNVLNEGLRVSNAPNYRKELVNSPGPVTVSKATKKLDIDGSFPFQPKGLSKIAKELKTTAKDVKLGTLEYDKGTLIFYGGDGISASLNPSDLNTDFADNSNWYDDICDGKITAKITPKIKQKDGSYKKGTPIELTDAQSAAWIATAPPDYAPQIQPLSTMYDLICGAANDEYTNDLSLVFPFMYRLYRMQWVNVADFLSPSFKETIDRITAEGNFKYIYEDDGSEKAKAIRNEIFLLFRNPEYNYSNEPIIPAAAKTDLVNLGSGTQEVKLPTYPGDGINYPGSPAQWFAIPPMLYKQLEAWKDGGFPTPKGGPFSSIDDLGEHYRNMFIYASEEDEGKSALLNTRAVLETLYGGGFHPGVELTWPMRHSNIYAENCLTYDNVYSEHGQDFSFFGLREIRINKASDERQKEIFYNDFGLLMVPDDISDSLNPKNSKSWFWEITPGDLTKWMGIPWQSDAGSCQQVFTDSQYPIPAWWAANLPVTVLTQASLDKMQDESILDTTKEYIYANRLAWLHTADTGYQGYHAEGGYMNGLINMVYKWKDVGVVTGRASKVGYGQIPETVYVSIDAENIKNKPAVFLGEKIASKPTPAKGEVFYTNLRESVYIQEGKTILLSSTPNGKGEIAVDDVLQIMVNGQPVYEYDFSNNCTTGIIPQPPVNLTDKLKEFAGNFVTIEIKYADKCGGDVSASGFYLAFK